MQTAFIGATVQLRVVHPLQLPAVDVAPTPGIENSADAAHVSVPVQFKAVGAKVCNKLEYRHW